jgi:hypothetical protein
MGKNGGRAIEFDEQRLSAEQRRVAKAIAAGVPAAPRQTLQTPDVGRYADYLDGVVGYVEATSYEKHALWNEYAIEALPFHKGDTKTRYDWKETGSGYLANIGMIDGRPIWISLLTATVAGSKLLFWYVTSPVSDIDQCNAWLSANLPAAALNNRSDPMNFTHVLPR